MDDRKLKIAMLGHKYIPSREGGIEVVVEELAARLVQRGHQVTCYNRSRRLTTPPDYVPIREYKGIRLKTVFTIEQRGWAAMTSSLFGALCTALGRYDIVHFHAEGPCFFIWLPKLFRKTCVATIHSLDWQRAKWRNGFASKYIHWGEKAAVRFADRIIVLSPSVQDYFAQTYGRETIVIPNGVTRPQPQQADQITQQFGLHKDEYLLFLGRIVPEKGLEYLIQAYKQLHTEKKLVIAGGGSDTERYVKDLQDLCASEERIVFTGFVEGQLLEELYSNAYLYCLPSDLEGMPLSLMEAMSYGNCCVVSDIPECADVVEDYGIVFQKGNVADLTDKLQNLCDHPNQVEDMKRASADYICGKYSWEDMANQTLEVYGSH